MLNFVLLPNCPILFRAFGTRLIHGGIIVTGGLGLEHGLYNISFSIFLITSNSVSRVSMLRLRSHLLCIEWTLPRCSKNTGQLVAAWARLVTAERIRSGNILKPFLIFFYGKQSSGNILTCHKNVHLTGFNCRSSLLLAISDVTCDITSSIPMSRYSKRLR